MSWPGCQKREREGGREREGEGEGERDVGGNRRRGLLVALQARHRVLLRLLVQLLEQLLQVRHLKAPVWELHLSDSVDRLARAARRLRQLLVRLVASPLPGGRTMWPRRCGKGPSIGPRTQARCKAPSDVPWSAKPFSRSSRVKPSAGDCNCGEFCSLPGESLLMRSRQQPMPWACAERRSPCRPLESSLALSFDVFDLRCS